MADAVRLGADPEALESMPVYPNPRWQTRERRTPNRFLSEPKNHPFLFMNYTQPQPKRPQIVLPSTGRPESKFATELGQEIGPIEKLFQYDGSLVEIIEEDYSGARNGMKFG